MTKPHDYAEAAGARIAELEHQLKVYRTAHEAATTAVQIYGDKLMIDQLTQLGVWPEQIDAALTDGERYVKDE